MNVSNYTAVLDLLLDATAYSLKLQRALKKAQDEGRDITDEEIADLRKGNMGKIDDLLSRP